MEVTSWPLVTLGLCVRNNESTIAKAFESVVCVTYPRDRMEIIIVDGMSKDSTVGIIERMSKDTDTKSVLLFDNGKGLAYARQMVVEHAQGKYVLWIDGDNIIPRNFVESHAMFMEANPDVGVACSNFLPKGKSVVARLQGYQWLIPSIERTSKGYYVGKMGTQGTICRIDAIREVGGFDLSIKGAGEDVDLFVRIKAQGWKIARNNRAVISHYMRETWKSLWKESCWWGYGTHYLASKHKNCFPNLRRRAGLTMLECLALTIKSIKVTRDIACLLMPVHYVFRRLGFLAGHIRAYRDSYH